MPRGDRGTDVVEKPPRRRTARGERRRDALIDAATELLDDDGFAAVTHRAVAARAGIPLAATTYYFSSREELVEQALRQLGASHLDTAHAVLARQRRRRVGARAIAAVVVEIVAGPDTDGPATLLTFYERYMQAGRHPALRPIVAELTEDLQQLVAVALERADYEADPHLPRMLVALVDGVLVAELARGGSDPRGAARRSVGRLLDRGVAPIAR